MHQPLLLHLETSLKLSRTGAGETPRARLGGVAASLPSHLFPSLPSPPLSGGGSGNRPGRGKEPRAALVAEVVAERWSLAWSVCSSVGLSRHGCAGTLSVDSVSAAVAAAASGW